MLLPLCVSLPHFFSVSVICLLVFHFPLALLRLTLFVWSSLRDIPQVAFEKTVMDKAAEGEEAKKKYLEVNSSGFNSRTCAFLEGFCFWKMFSFEFVMIFGDCT